MNSVIYVTGDTHGALTRVQVYEKEYGMNAGDTLLIAGDFGFIFRADALETSALDALERLPFTLLFVDGNHECFPAIYAYPEENWHGGRIHRIRSNVLHLMRGQVFDLEGTTVFTMGGGYSLDCAMRVPGRSWWPEEMPSEDEYAEAMENLRKHGSQVDVIVTHAAPDETMQMLQWRGVFSERCVEELRLNVFLEEVRRTVRYQRWYFGHMHVDMPLFRSQTALYMDVYNLITGEKAEPLPQG